MFSGFSKMKVIKHRADEKKLHKSYVINKIFKSRLVAIA